MKNFAKHVTHWLLCMSVSACMRPVMEPTPQSDGVLARFHVSPADAQDVKSACFGDDCMNRISDINLFVFRDGKMCVGCEAYGKGGSLEVELPVSGTAYNLYFIANVGDVRLDAVENCRDEKDMRAWVLSAPEYSMIKDRGVPMSAVVEAWHPGDATDIFLKRLASRIDVRFVNSSEYQVDVKSMVLRQSVGRMRPFTPGFAARGVSDMMLSGDYDDYLTTVDVEEASNGRVAHLYCLENMHGDLLPDNDDPKEKNLANLPAGKASLVTYFEVNANVTGNAVRWDNVVYRFCLGRDVTRNFDIPRNAVMAYTLDFRSTPHDTGWTIVPEEPIYSDYVDVQLTHASYYPSWDVLDFPSASSRNPVTAYYNGRFYEIDGKSASIHDDDIKELDKTCIVVGSKMYIRCCTPYSVHLSQDGHMPKTVGVDMTKERLSFYLAGDNERGNTVKVEHLCAGGRYSLPVVPYHVSGGVFLPWKACFFPDEVISAAGADTVDMWMRKNFGLGLEDYGDEDYDSFSTDYSTDYSSLGQPWVDVVCPGRSTTMDYGFVLSGYGVSSSPCEMNVFDPHDLPVLRQFPLISFDNSCADLVNPDATDSYSFNIGGQQAFWADGAWKKNAWICEGGHGRINLRVNPASRSFDVSVDGYSCGHYDSAVCFWDYDQAPTGLYRQPFDVFLDLTYVPAFGILMNAGKYGVSTFSGASVTTGPSSTSIETKIWGYQFLPARADSRFRTDFGSGIHDEMMQRIAQGAPYVVCMANPYLIPKGRVASYNAGSILYNMYAPDMDSYMPNQGSVYFCDPAGSVLSRCVYTYPARVSAPYYRYNFAPQTPKKILNNNAEVLYVEILNKDMQLSYDGSNLSEEFPQVRLGDIYVNYRIMCDTCLEVLMDDWARY